MLTVIVVRSQEAADKLHTQLVQLDVVKGKLRHFEAQEEGDLDLVPTLRGRGVHGLHGKVLPLL